MSDDEEEEKLQPQASGDWRLPTDMEGWGKLPHVM
jgi:hypothetical protein